MIIDISKRLLIAGRNRLALRSVRRNLGIRKVQAPLKLQIAQALSILSKKEIPIVQAFLNDEEVDLFAQKAEYEFYYPSYYSHNEMLRLKKIREHFMAAQLLKLNPEDVYLDIASQYSPAPFVYERLYGCQVFRQDLEYPPGKNRRVIGGSAGKMTLPDNSITKAAMHCSLEHFEGNEDIALFKEVFRVLSPGGILAIVPLYLSDVYSIFTQPSLFAYLPGSEWPQFDRDAQLYEIDGGNRYERYFSGEQFIDRLVGATPMKCTVYSFDSEPSYHPGQMRLAAVFEKPLLQ